MIDIFTNPLFLAVIFAGFAISITSGIIGSYVVTKRIVFISGSIAHSVLGGMGFFLYLKRIYDIPWLSPMYGALIAAILSALLIGWVQMRYKEREDTVIAAIWSLGMAIGVIFTSFTPGYNTELTNFLFGNILWVNETDIFTALSLDLIIIALSAIFHRRFVSICFDEKQALLQKIHVRALYYLLLCLIALSVVLLIQIVGAILVIAMLAIPPSIAGRFSHRLSTMMFIAIFINCLFIFLGTILSFTLNWPPGATIALTASICYLLNFFLKPKALH